MFNPIPAIIFAKSSPDSPVKGMPAKSSEASGISPIIIKGAEGIPRAKTVLAAVFFSVAASKERTRFDRDAISVADSAAITAI